MSSRGITLPCGRVTLVSEEDYAFVSQFSWYDRSQGYVAGRWKKSLGGDGKIVLLSRLITRAPAGLMVDHIDGDTFNNTRENLQVVTNSRNLMRAAHRKWPGVTLHNGKWEGRLRVDGRIVRLGAYDTREEAVAMVAAAREHVWNDQSFNELGVTR